MNDDDGLSWCWCVFELFGLVVLCLLRVLVVGGLCVVGWLVVVFVVVCWCDWLFGERVRGD